LTAFLASLRFTLRRDLGDKGQQIRHRGHLRGNLGFRLHF
jgi:hypothetical protein